MAEDKKKAKIDLKARLGKTTQTGMPPVPMPVPGAAPSAQSSAPGAPSAPPSADGVPPPVVPVPSPSVRPAGGGIAPPPGLSPGIPLPPFARPKAEPAAKPSAQQQTIKVEVGEEIHEERRKATKRAALYAGIAAVVAFGAGFGIGGVYQTGQAGKRGVEAAGTLEKEVKEANSKLKELNEKLNDAAEKLGRKEYPADLAAALGGLNVPFEGANLEKPGVGNVGKAFRPLLKFAGAVQDLNASKEDLKNMLGPDQPKVEKQWKEEKDPVVNFSVIFRPEGGKGMVAELVVNKEPFKIGADFPKEYQITKAEMQGGQLKPVDKKAVRWLKGDLTGNDPVAIPVTPQTTAALSERVLRDLVDKITDLRLDINGGRNPGTPQETQGLLKDGEDLARLLHDVANAK